jgi:dihydroorotate dehydrogenase (fumarate)
MNLQTNYMGLTLKNPLVVSSSPISANEDTIQQAVEAGASAIVLPSLFEEQIIKCGFDYPYFPDAEDYNTSPEEYFKLLKKTSRHSSVPIIASLNGESGQGWDTYAKKMQDAGAHGLELNIYHIAADAHVSGQDIETLHLSILESVKKAIDIPVALKLNPYFSSLGHMAQQFKDAGADALVLFNRFYQPDFNIVALEIEPNLNLSGPSEIRLPLRWTAILSDSVDLSIGASTGVQSGVEVIKYLLAGADAVMTASALIQHGPQYIETLLQDLERWMKANDYESVEEFKGFLSQNGVKNASEFERANYIKVLEKFKRNLAQTNS